MKKYVSPSSGKRTRSKLRKATLVLPRHAEQICEEALVILRLCAFPPGRGLEGDECPAPSVTPPGEDGQLFVEHAHHVHGAEAVEAARTWKRLGEKNRVNNHGLI